MQIFLSSKFLLSFSTSIKLFLLFELSLLNDSIEILFDEMLLIEVFEFFFFLFELKRDLDNFSLILISDLNEL